MRIILHIAFFLILSCSLWGQVETGVDSESEISVTSLDRANENDFYVHADFEGSSYAKGDRVILVLSPSDLKELSKELPSKEYELEGLVFKVAGWITGDVIHVTPENENIQLPGDMRVGSPEEIKLYQVDSTYVADTKDSDSDGVPDTWDAFDSDPNEALDSDGDGRGDYSDSFPLDAAKTEPSSNAQDLEEGLIGYWPFDDLSHPKWTPDLSSGGNHGTINGQPEIVAGASGGAGDYAIQFDGSDDSVTTEVSLLNELEELTLSFWMLMPEQQPGNRVGLIGQNDAVEYGMINPTTMQYWTPAGSINVDFGPTLEEWTHVAVIVNDEGMHVYSNGEQIGTAAGGGPVSSTFNFNMGGSGVYDGTGNWFLGSLDDVAVWNVALSEDQIKSLAAKQIYPKVDRVTPDNEVEFYYTANALDKGGYLSLYVHATGLPNLEVLSDGNFKLLGSYVKLVINDSEIDDSAKFAGNVFKVTYVDGYADNDRYVFFLEPASGAPFPQDLDLTYPGVGNWEYVGSEFQGLRVAPIDLSENQQGELSDGLIGYWPFDGGSDVAKDLSKNSNHGTVIGQPEYVVGLSGNPDDLAIKFDGEDDSVTTGVSLLNDLDEFTLSFWMKMPEKQKGDLKGIIGQNDAVEFGMGTPNSMLLWNEESFNVVFGPTFDDWSHIAIVVNDGRFLIYKDSILIGEKRGAGWPGESVSSNSEFVIGGGGIFDPAGNFFLGYLDDVAVYNIALTTENISDLASRAVVPLFEKVPLVPDLIAYWPFDGNLNDRVGNSHGEAQGTGSISYDEGQFGLGIDLDGVDQFIQTPRINEEMFDFQHGNGFSISAWYRVDGFSKSWQALIAKGEGNRWRVHRRASEDQLTAVGGSGGDFPGGTGNVNDDQIHHIILVNDPDNDVVRLYSDGEEVAVQGGALEIGNNDKPMMIGENPDARNRTWNGLIDDVGIWNRAITEDEIDLIYNGGNGNALMQLADKKIEQIAESSRQQSSKARSYVKRFDGNPGGAKFILKEPQGNSVDLASVKAKFDDKDVEVKKFKDGLISTVEYIAESALDPNSYHTFMITYTDQNGTVEVKHRDFHVPDYLLIDEGAIVSDDRGGQSGFIANITQISNRQSREGFLHGNQIAGAESQINGEFVHWETGDPYLNEADPDADLENFSYYPVVVKTVNQNQNAPSEGEAGNFDASNGYKDQKIPGIPGWHGETDGIAGEYLTLLQLDRGSYTLGVNSDDGFKATIGANFHDLAAQTIGFFNGGRGVHDTIFDIFVSKSGLYPFRVLWFEGVGGASIEIFSMIDGRKVLINDPDVGGSIKAYTPKGATVDESINETDATTGRAYLADLNPKRFSTNREASVILINGDESTLDEGSVRVTLNGEVANHSIKKDGDKRIISFLGKLGKCNATVEFTELNGNKRSVKWTFMIADPVNPGDLNLLAHWSFDEDLYATSVTDSVRGLDGVLRNDARITNDGLRGNALDTTANRHSFVRVDDGEILNLAGMIDQVTFAFWQKIQRINHDISFWAYSHSSGHNGRGALAHTPWNNGELFWDTSGCCGANETRISKYYSNNIEDWDKWNHFAYVKEGDMKRIYINGKLFHAGLNTEPLKQDFDFLNIMAEGVEGSGSPHAQMDDFAIFASALDEEQLSDLMTGKLLGAKETPSLIVTQAADITAEANQFAEISLAISEDVSSVLWERDGVRVGTGASLQYGPLTLADNGSKFRAAVVAANGFIHSDEVTLTVTPDKTAPELVSAVGSRLMNTFTLSFNEDLGEAGNYTIDGLDVNSAKIADRHKIVLSTSVQTPGTVYTVSVKGVKDNAGNSTNAEVNVDAFVHATGFLWWDSWTGIHGAHPMEALTENENYPDNPTVSQLLPYLNTRQATGFQKNGNSHYGARASGWLIAPETGKYRIFLRSDDHGQVWIENKDDQNAFRVVSTSEAGLEIPTPPKGLSFSSKSTAYVLQAGDVTYWIYSYRDNRFAMEIVAYNAEGEVLHQVTGKGTRYFNHEGMGEESIQINEEAQTVTFMGQNNLPFGDKDSVTLSYDDLEIPRGAYEPKMELIAEEEGCCRGFQVDVGGVSGLVDLEEGEWYWFEALLKEGHGGDWMVVGWRRPSENLDETPWDEAGIDGRHFMNFIPKGALGYGSGEYLMDGNVKTIESPTIYSRGIAPGSAEGLTIREFREIGGPRLADDLFANPKWPNNPDWVGHAEYAEWPLSGRITMSPHFHGQRQYAVQLLGYVTPPDTGDYHFFISNVNTAALFISPNENPADKVRIAMEPIGNANRSFDNDRQMPINEDGLQVNGSEAIRLVKGQHYFIEAIMKKAGAYGSVSITWTKEGEDFPKNEALPIAGEYLSPFLTTRMDITSADDVVIPSSKVSPDREQAPNAIDNDPRTKYLNFDGKNNTPSGLYIYTTDGGLVTGLRLTSANDAPDRDPASFIIWGSNDDESFTKIASADIPAFAERFQRKTVNFDNSVAYKSYKILFPKTAGSSTCCMQIAEIELLGFPPAFEVTKRIDGEGEIKLEPDLEKYPLGSVVEMTALPAAGYAFAGWSDDIIIQEEVSEQARSYTGMSNSMQQIITGSSDLTLSEITVSLWNAYEIKPDGSGYIRDNPDLVTDATLWINVFEQKKKYNSWDDWSPTIWREEEENTFATSFKEILPYSDKFSEVSFTFPNNFILKANKTYVFSVRGSKLDGKETNNLGIAINLSSGSSEPWGTAGGHPGALYHIVEAGEAAVDYSGLTQTTKVVIDSNKSFKATFLEKFTVDLTAFGPGSITANPAPLPGGIYYKGTRVTLTAEGDDGFSFLGWEKDLSGDANPIQITIDSSKKIRGNFIPAHKITRLIDGDGQIILEPNAEDFPEGSTVKVTALPAEGSGFAGWGEGQSGLETTFEVTMDADKTYKANFKSAWNVELNTNGGGKIITPGVSETYSHNLELKLIGDPDWGWRFLDWGGDLSGEVNPATLLVNYNKSVTANFVEKDTDGDGLLDNQEKSLGILHNNTDSDGDGLLDGDEVNIHKTKPDNVDSDGDGLSDSLEVAIGSNPNDRGSILPLDGSPLLYVNGKLTRDSPVSKVDSAKVEFRSNFSDGTIFYTMDGSDPSENGSIYSDEIELFEDANIRAVALSSDFSQSKPLDKVYELKIVDSFTVEATTIGGGAVSIDPAQDRYLVGTTITVSASPEAGWSFVAWKGSSTSGEKQLSIKLESNLKLEAVFGTKINTTKLGQGSLGLKPSQEIYHYGTSVSVSAVASEGWKHNGWGGVALGKSNPFDLVVNQANTKVVGIFAQKIQDPLLEWPLPELFLYGTDLATIQRAKALDPETRKELQGKYDYTPEAGERLPVGLHKLRVKFSPSDGVKYRPKEVEKSLVVKPLKIRILAKDASRAYGVGNPDFGYVIDGRYIEQDLDDFTAGLKLSSEAGVTSVSGEYEISITGSYDGNNYEIDYVPGKLMVDKVKPEVVWEPDQVVYYGARVDEALIKAEASVPGKYIVYPLLGHELSLGTPTVTLYFIPDDKQKYGSVTIKKKFTVKKRPLEIGVRGASRGVGEPNPDFEITYKGFLSGDKPKDLSSLPKVTTEADEGSPVGEYAIEVSGGSSLHYELIYKPGVLKVMGAPRILVDGKEVTKEKIVVNDFARLSFDGGFDGGVILYTLNGSDPVNNGKTYKKEIKLNDDVLVSVVGFNSDFSNYTASKTVVEIIVRTTFLVDLAESGGGEVYITGPKDRYGEGEKVVVNANAESGWELLSWDGIDADKEDSQSITVNKDLLIGAVFGTTISPSQIGQGDLNIEPNKNLYAHGETVSLLAKPKKGWVFDRWAGSLSGSANPKILTVENPKIRAVGVFAELDKELPVVTWVKPSAITYGEELSNQQLNATANVSGVFTYDPPLGKRFDVGRHSLSLIFNPDDKVNYLVVSKEVLLEVSKEVLTVSAKDALRAYGAANPKFELEYNGFVYGETSEALITKPFIQTSADEFSSAGMYDLKVLGGKSNNYDLKLKNGTLTVYKEAPEIVWEIPENIPYGTKLVDMYTAVAKMKGSEAEFKGRYKYSPSSSIVLGVGEHELKVVFTPENTDNFDPIEERRMLKVLPSSIKIRAKDITKEYGEKNPVLDYTVEGAYIESDMEELRSHVLVTTAADDKSAVGKYLIKIAGVDGGRNYRVKYLNGSLIISKKKPSVIWEPKALYDYGVRVDEGLLKVKSDVEGVVTSNLEFGTLLPVGVNQINLIFTPTNNANYEQVLLEKEIQVKKAPLTIRVKNATKGVGFENPLFELLYEGFIESEGPLDLIKQPGILTLANKQSPIGDYSVVVSGAESGNYDIEHVSGTLSVMEQLSLVLSLEGDGVINVSPEKEFYAFDEEVTLAVIPGEWYRFKEWDDGNTDNPRFIKPSLKHVFTAKLESTVELETLVFDGVEKVAPVGMPTFFINDEHVSEQGEWTIPDSAQIKIASTFTNANILYTINDGNELFYTEPFEIAYNATLKATAYSEDFSVFVESKELKLKVKPKLGLIFTTKGGGSVSASPDKTGFFEGEKVVLTAVADEGWRLIGWRLNGEFVERSVIDHTFEKALKAEAVFGTEVSLRSIPPNAGEMSISVDKDIFEYGEKIQIQSKASEGYYLATLSGKGFSSKLTPATFEVLEPGPNLAGLFLKLPGEKVTLNALVRGKGAIEIVENGTGNNIYNKGLEVLIRAVASEGNIFQGWSGDLESDSSEINLRLDTTKTIFADFDSGFVLDLSRENGDITKNPNLETYSTGDKVVLEAAPDKGFGFVEWTGDLSGTDRVVELTMDKNYSIGAVFEKAFEIKKNIIAGKGEIVCDPDRDRFLEGAIVSLRAIPAEGFDFVEWNYEGNTLQTSRIPSFEITKDLSYSASFKDVQAPRVTILEPLGGETDNENINLRGLVQDNGLLEEVNWFRGGELQGTVKIEEQEKFNIKGIVLQKGDNSYTVVAKDGAGNESSEMVTVKWEPKRTLLLADAPERQEGKRINIPVRLNSKGDVGGMTFILNYDKQLLSDPVLIWSSAAGASINSVNTDVAGEVKATFSLVGSGLPAGDQLIASVSLRVRSVPSDIYTDYSLEVLDLSLTDGSQVNFGTYVDPGKARLLQRKYNGDNNGNNRLDIGDGTLVQRLLTGFDQERSWDASGNDLNGNGKLDSGDVILLLRTVVGLNKQPSTGNRDIIKMQPKMVIKMGGDEEPVEMAAIRLVEKTSSNLRLQIVSENLEGDLSGISFTLVYPADKISILDSSGVEGKGQFSLNGAVKYESIGGVVPEKAVAIINVFANESSRLAQSGKVRVALSNVKKWNVVNGMLAEFEMEVREGFNVDNLEIGLRDVELTPTGYDNRMLPDIVLPLGEEPKSDPLTILDLSLKPLSFSFKTIKGATYDIEASVDLRGWNKIQTIDGGGEGVRFTDTRETLFERQYYRVKIVE